MPVRFSTNSPQSGHLTGKSPRSANERRSGGARVRGAQCAATCPVGTVAQPVPQERGDGDTRWRCGKLGIVSRMPDYSTLAMGILPVGRAGNNTISSEALTHFKILISGRSRRYSAAGDQGPIGAGQIHIVNRFLQVRCDVAFRLETHVAGAGRFGTVSPLGGIRDRVGAGELRTMWWVPNSQRVLDELAVVTGRPGHGRTSSCHADSEKPARPDRQPPYPR